MTGEVGGLARAPNRPNSRRSRPGCSSVGLLVEGIPHPAIRRQPGSVSRFRVQLSNGDSEQLPLAGNALKGVSATRLELIR